MFVFVFATAMTLLTLGTLASRSDYKHQFIGSGAPTINAFLVQDILTATCAHLIINVLLRLTGAGVAIAAAKMRLPKRRSAHY